MDRRRLHGMRKAGPPARMVELNRSGVYGEIVYTPSGDKLALMNGQSLVKAFVPLTGGATAIYSSSGLAYYRHSDWLGSSRLATTPTQTMYNDVAYAPYGETYAQTGTADFSFTGMNEDVEQNANPATLYDFLAREYGIQGRWPSPDPAGIGAVDPSNPQSWNRYAYVLNNPLAMTDPTGMEGIVLPCGDPVSCIIESIISAIFDIFQFLFGPPPVPQAAPAPPGGYGAGIEALGTYDEGAPTGVQVFPSSITGIPNGSGCTNGGDVCEGSGYAAPNGGYNPGNSAWAFWVPRAGWPFHLWNWVPNHGNWCGPNYSGGQNPTLHGGQDGSAGPVDALDIACQQHDGVYGSTKDPKLLHDADVQLLHTAENLPDDPQYDAYKTVLIQLFKVRTGEY